MLLSIFGDEMSDAMARDVITVCDLLYVGLVDDGLGCGGS
jgi:hypothetical protein